MSNMEKTRQEFYIGGDPPTGDFDTGSTEVVREWARSAAEKPAPIKYKLDAIDNLFAKEYFRYLDSGNAQYYYTDVRVKIETFEKHGSLVFR